VSTFTKKDQKFVILAVTLGNILEWYEIYLYIYWAPILSNLFFDTGAEATNLINTFVIFAIGFLARPIGGLFFGRLGDRIGRKKAFILSIITMTGPTFLMGCLPTYAAVGWIAPFLLAGLRILQSFPSGGELPGAFCFLYECADSKNRIFMTSWGAVGNQIGIIISLLECYFLETYLSYEDLISFGWRISFIAGGIIGLAGFFLRLTLNETRPFKDLVYHHEVSKKSLVGILIENRSKIWKGILFGAVNAAAFYLLSVSFPVYFQKIFGTSYKDNIFTALFLLIATTLPLPFFGKLGDKIRVKWPLILSTIIIMLITYPLYVISQFDHYNNYTIAFAITLVLLFTACLTCITALMPFLLTNLFTTSVRFTCLGFTFNVADGVVGGLSPLVALFLTNITGNKGAFCFIILACSIVSLYSYFTIQEE